MSRFIECYHCHGDAFDNELQESCDTCGGAGEIDLDRPNIHIHSDLEGIHHARKAGERSKCKKFKIGAALVIDGVIIRTSYNGTEPGDDLECEHDCLICNGTGVGFDEICFNCNGTGLSSYDRVRHAERNITDWAKLNGIDISEGTIYVTLQPCLACATLIQEAGIKRVVYIYTYKNNDGLDHLFKHGVEFSELFSRDTGPFPHPIEIP